MICYTVPLEQIPHIDHPELRINKNESMEMPFRYVTDVNGKPIMPDVSQEYSKSVFSTKFS
jgi:ribosome biogenesis SPOUT family RNA methylase Rps3